jgi:hypothetical protein
MPTFREDKMLRIWEMASLGTAAMALVLAVSPAQAAGCNGHVNAMEWGCAPWDNNNGPQFPHYTKPAPRKAATPAPSTLATGHARPVVNNNARVAPPAQHTAPIATNRNGHGVIAAGGGNTIAAGGGNVVGPGGASLLSTNGGNFHK